MVITSIESLNWGDSKFMFLTHAENRACFIANFENGLYFDIPYSVCGDADTFQKFILEKNFKHQNMKTIKDFLGVNDG